MLTAKLNFADGTAVERPIDDGQTVPNLVQHVDEGDDATTLRIFQYRKGQLLDDHFVHYDEIRSKVVSVRIRPA